MAAYQNMAFLDNYGRVLVWHSGVIILPEDAKELPLEETELHSRVQKGLLHPIRRREDILKEMVARNPHINSLIEKLNLK